MQDAVADAAIARRVLAREPAGYADLYDRYAAPLYAYCYTMLGDRERAAAALGMTLMIAVCRLDELRDPDRLRPWLYALARNECRCRAHGRAGPGLAGFASAGAGKVRDGGHGSEAPRAQEGEPLAAAELSHAAIVAAAMRGLSLDDREAVELCLRHHLAGLDLADVLGMPARRAHAVVTRASVRLRPVLGTLLVARWGREDCPDLAGMLVGWDGRPTAMLSRRVRRHIGYCDTCRARERRELPSGGLAGVLAETAQPAPPPGLRDEVLRELAVTPGAAAEGDLIVELVAHRAGSFGSSGFPPPPGRRSWRADHPQQVAGAAASLAALGAVIVLYGVIPGGGTPSAGLVQPTGSAAVASSTGGASGTRAGPGGGSASAGPTPSPAGPVPGVTPAGLTAAPSTSPASSPASNGSPTRSASASKSASPARSPFSPIKSPSPTKSRR